MYSTVYTVLTHFKLHFIHVEPKGIYSTGSKTWRQYQCQKYQKG